MFLLCVVTFLTLSHSAEAGITYTVEAPGVQQTSVVGATTQNFNSFNASSAIGTYSGNYNIKPADLFGGAGGAGSYFTPTPGGPGAALVLAQPAIFFGLWWSAAGPNSDLLSFYDPSNTLLGTYDVSTFSALPSTYNGNPNNGGLNSSEKYFYVNFFATAGSTISRVTFGGPFESDNHSFIAAPAQGVPENGSSIALFATSAGGLVAMRRRLRRA
ncbi:MAG: hypothetical protein ACJ71N_04200 [Terriglobales bacterium]